MAAPMFANLVAVLPMYDDHMLVELTSLLATELARRGKFDAANYATRAKAVQQVELDQRRDSTPA